MISLFPISSVRFAVPFRTILMTEFQALLDNLSNGATKFPAALLMTILGRPNSPTQAETASCTCLGSLTSHATAKTLGNKHDKGYSETRLERPLPWDHPSWNIIHFWQDLLFNITEPVTRDHLSWQTTFFVANGVVFQDRFYCIYKLRYSCFVLV